MCCLRNLQENRHGDLLDELAEAGHDVSLAHCLHQCAGCRRGPALEKDGIWHGASDKEALRLAIGFYAEPDENRLPDRRKPD
ncbi:hypothetical protein SAMN02799624_01738 [Paenibacillus sp. UNC496MF]|nr:hypothetical protein SAMN02799624_01738 [Paenibacillus sp. UNC496MF]